MNVTLLNGALPGDPFTDALAGKLAHEYATQGADVTAWRLRDHKVAYCLGCFECWTRTPGLCRIDDDARAISASIIRSDLRVDITPVTFGGYSSELKKVLDRSICLIMPFFTRIDGEVHHKPRYPSFPQLRVVGVLPHADPEQEALFRLLIDRNAINMHAPAHSVEFVYRNLAPAGASMHAAAVPHYELPNQERVPA